MEAVWFSEIEKFPNAVLTHHWPNVANLGDMCTLPDMVKYGLIEAPDILVGGTPCQAFSVAGLRKGLEDERGQLTLKYVELLDEIDKKRPNDECVAVWENVPGVLSSKDNAFGCFLGALAGEDCELHPSGEKWTKSGSVFGPKRTITWRILDAQYFGVAQRRRRVFVVASARRGFDPAKVLLESEGLRRDIAPCRETGENVTRSANNSIEQGFEAFQHHQWRESNLMNTLTANMKRGVCGDTPLVVRPIHDKTTRYEGQTGIGSGNGLGIGKENDPMFTLTTGDKHAVHSVEWPAKIAATLNASFGDKQGLEDQHALNGVSWFVPTTSTVRRLTPKECERLQGFPDNHTQIPYRNKSIEYCPDGPRYKAIGNSKAVPVIRWVGERILKQLNKGEPTK